MLSSETNHGTNFWGRQLSLNLTQDSSLSVARTANKVHAITSGEITFHPEVSKISENSFALKVSYMGKSYSLNGVYRKDQIRSFDREDFSATAIHIVHSNIFTFQGGRYVSTFVSKKEYEALIKSAQNILQKSTYNTTIQ